MPTVYLGIGSNIERERHMRAGIAALRSEFGDIVVSPLYETEAVGFDGDPFFNCVVAAETNLELSELAVRLREIEADNGRVRSGEKFSGRTLDIDIVCYGDLAGEHAGISLPRDEVYKYAFVLKPLADISPEMCCPGSDKTWAQMWEAFAGEKNMSLVSDFAFE